MTRLNLILFFALIFSALGLVKSQHKARNLYIELEHSNHAAKLIEQEYGQLQLEQSTWAMHSRIEQIAAMQMQMEVPDGKRVQVVAVDRPMDVNQLVEEVKPAETATTKVAH
jgi:cell division protein FtsL